MASLRRTSSWQYLLSWAKFIAWHQKRGMLKGSSNFSDGHAQVSIYACPSSPTKKWLHVKSDLLGNLDKSQSLWGPEIKLSEMDPSDCFHSSFALFSIVLAELSSTTKDKKSLYFIKFCGFSSTWCFLCSAGMFFPPKPTTHFAYQAYTCLLCHMR